LQQVESEI